MREEGDILKDVMTMNNRCIEGSHHDNLLYGISELQRAVSIMKEAVIIMNEDNNSTTPSPITMKMVHIKFRYQPLTTSSTSTSSKLVNEPFNLTEISKSPIMLCNRPLLFVMDNDSDVQSNACDNHDSCRTTTDTTRSTDCLHLITSTLLFNLSLLCHTQAYHGDGRHTIIPHPTCLLNVSHMYQLVIEMFHRNSYNDKHDVDDNANPMEIDDTNVNDSTTTTTFTSYMKIIATVACNNYGQICYALSNYEQYQNCMDTLQYIICNCCCNHQNKSINIMDRSKIMNHILHQIEKDTNDRNNDNNNDVSLYHTTIIMDGCEIYDDIKLNLLLFYNLCSFLPIVALAA